MSFNSNHGAVTMADEPLSTAFLQVVSGGVGGALLTKLADYLIARRTSSAAATVDLRKTTDLASATLIGRLQDLHRECEVRMASLDARVDVLERLLPVVRIRDGIMQAHIEASGGQLPRMPPITWPDGT